MYFWICSFVFKSLTETWVSSDFTVDIILSDCDDFFDISTDTTRVEFRDGVCRLFCSAQINCTDLGFSPFSVLGLCCKLGLVPAYINTNFLYYCQYTFLILT